MEGLEEDVSDKAYKDEGRDCCGVVMEDMVHMKVVDHIVEALVFDFPSGVAETADGLGGCHFLFYVGDPEPV